MEPRTSAVCVKWLPSGAGRIASLTLLEEEDILELRLSEREVQDTLRGIGGVDLRESGMPEVHVDEDDAFSGLCCMLREVAGNRRLPSPGSAEVTRMTFRGVSTSAKRIPIRRARMASVKVESGFTAARFSNPDASVAAGVTAALSAVQAASQVEQG